MIDLTVLRHLNQLKPAAERTANIHQFCLLSEIDQETNGKKDVKQNKFDPRLLWGMLPTWFILFGVVFELCIPVP